MKLQLVIGSIILAFIAMGFYSIYSHYGPYAVERELNRIIKVKHVDIIEKLSDTPETREFLIAVPKDSKANHTTDCQGGNPEAQYYNTLLAGQFVSVIIKEDNHSSLYNKIFPKWTITNLHYIKY